MNAIMNMLWYFASCYLYFNIMLVSMTWREDQSLLFIIYNDTQRSKDILVVFHVVIESDIGMHNLSKTVDHALFASCKALVVLCQ
jgi:hypothetical protein